MKTELRQGPLAFIATVLLAALVAVCGLALCWRVDATAGEDGAA